MLIPFAKILQRLQSVGIVGCERENFAIFSFGFFSPSQLGIGLPQRKAQIVSSSPHAQGFGILLYRLFPYAELVIHRRQFGMDRRRVLALGSRFFQQSPRFLELFLGFSLVF